jgi:hypothetical protein
MILDSAYSGPEGVTREDLGYQGSTFSEVRRALFANAYYLTWRGRDEPPLPVYDVTLRRALMGVLPFGRRWGFQQAARRTVEARSDLRWGPDRRGFRRIVHPNGVCLTGTWEIDAPQAGTGYTGYFKAGSRALIVARYSVCCTETRRGRYRSLSMVGKLYPTTDPNHGEPLRTANFITQEDFGGSKTRDISEAELRNAPDTTPWRRGAGVPVFLVTGVVLLRADKEPTIRQLHEIAELGKAGSERTSAPEFMRLITDPPPRVIEEEDLDFRDEILGRIYDEGNPAPQRTLTFHIEVSDEGRTRGKLVQRRTITGWKRIGRIVFREAVASYNGDFVIHFHHPVWRNDRNDPATVARKRLRR